MHVGECTTHADQRSGRAHEKRIAKKAILPRQHDCIRPALGEVHDMLEGHDGIEGRDLDAHNMWLIQDRDELLVGVGHPTGGLI